jgi:hypothetical protein
VAPAIEAFDRFYAGGFEFRDNGEAEVARHVRDPRLSHVEDVGGELMPTRRVAADRMAKEDVQGSDARLREVELDRRFAIGAGIPKDPTPWAVQERRASTDGAFASPLSPEGEEREAAFPIRTDQRTPPTSPVAARTNRPEVPAVAMEAPTRIRAINATQRAKTFSNPFPPLPIAASLEVGAQLGIYEVLNAHGDSSP